VRPHLLLLALPLFLCGSCRLLGLSDAWEDVQGASWRLVAIDGSPAPPELDARLQLDDGGRLFGELGSTPYFSSYARSGRRGLRIGKIGWSHAPQATLPLRPEERFLDLLKRSDSFSLRAGRLTLSQGGSDGLEFVPDR
jgi:heat shock protein HslJ